MRFQVIELSGLNGAMRREIHATADSRAEAVAAMRARFTVIHYEDDSLYPLCADAFTNCGRVLSIQPEGFSL